jgi:hypothetical protein
VNVNPLVIKLLDGDEPVRMSAHKEARDTWAERVEFGVKDLRNRVGESPAHPSEAWAQHRMTVDIHVPNASTEPTAWPLPNLQDD